MKKVVIHVGFPKTGTTSIQRFCDLHREELRAAGVDYPSLSIADDGDKAKPNHKALVMALMKNPPDRLEHQTSRALTLTNKVFETFMDSRLSTLFLSHETISRRDDIDFARLGDWVAGLPVTIVAFVRRSDEWMESLYAQSLRSDKAAARPFMESALSNPKRVGFLPQLRLFKAGLPDAAVRAVSFDRYKRGGLVEEVLARIGADSPALLSAAPEEKRENAARATVEVLFGAYASVAENDAGLTRQVVGAFGKARKDGAAIPFGERDFRFIPPALKIEAREAYRRDLDAMRAEFGLVADDPGPVPASELEYSSTLTRDEFDALYAVVRPYLPRRKADAIASAYAKAHPRFAGTVAPPRHRGPRSPAQTTADPAPGESVAVSDEEWALISPLLPPERGRGRRAAGSARRDFDAMAWMTWPGAQWRHLPEDYGKWNGVFQRYLRWTSAGVFDAMHEALAEAAERDTGAGMIESAAMRAERRALELKKGLAIPKGLADRVAALRPRSTSDTTDKGEHSARSDHRPTARRAGLRAAAPGDRRARRGSARRQEP